MVVEKAPRRRFTATEFELMARAGILAEDDRVELIDGEVRQMSPIGDRHYACVVRLADLFWQHLGRRVLVSVQNPVSLGAYDEPQPDIVLLSRAEQYPTAKPKPEEILLLVEVADASLEYDQGEKLAMYARSDVQEVWIVDLVNDVVTGYHSPRPARGDYQVILRRTRAQALAPRFAPGSDFRVEEILG
jgi:Uma2 family endonuclease